MKKTVVLLLCLVLLAGIVPVACAESTLTLEEAAAEWEKEYGDRRLWDYRINAEFDRQYADLYGLDPSLLATLPDENDSQTISAEEAEKLAFRLIPEFNAGLDANDLFALTCVVSCYEKPEKVGTLCSIRGSWIVEFWNTEAEEPEFVCRVYIDAVNRHADALILASRVRYECWYEAPQDAVRINPDGENDEAGQARMQAREIAAERFDADYGIDDYYASLIDTFGPFQFWTPEQKHEYCPILDELVMWEKQRLDLSGSDQPYKGFCVAGMILQWRYGSPESAAVTEEEARQKALDFLKAEYSLDCSDCNAGAALITGHWHEQELSDSYWVFTFCDGRLEEAVLKAEVWVNARTGALPKHRADDAREIVMEVLAGVLDEGFEIGGEPATEDMIDDVAVLYLEAQNEWLGIVTIGDSFLEVEIDADTMEALDSVRSNG